MRKIKSKFPTYLPLSEWGPEDQALVSATVRLDVIIAGPGAAPKPVLAALPNIKLQPAAEAAVVVLLEPAPKLLPPGSTDTPLHDAAELLPLGTADDPGRLAGRLNRKLLGLGDWLAAALLCEGRERTGLEKGEGELPSKRLLSSLGLLARSQSSSNGGLSS